MKDRRSLKRLQKGPVFVALLLFSLVLFLLQLWLFASVFENVVAKKYDTAVPAAVVSTAILLVNVWMLVGVNKLDRSD